MERLTEHHFKKAGDFYMKCSEHCYKEDFSCEDCMEFDKIVDRLGAIEDILGDDYDLGRLKELVESDRDGRCVVLPCKVGDKMQYIDSDESIGCEIVEKIVVEIETDGGIYSASELKPEDFKTPESVEGAVKGDQNGKDL